MMYLVRKLWFALTHLNCRHAQPLRLPVPTAQRSGPEGGADGRFFSQGGTCDRTIRAALRWSNLRGALQGLPAALLGVIGLGPRDARGRGERVTPRPSSETRAVRRGRRPRRVAFSRAAARGPS